MYLIMCLKYFVANLIVCNIVQSSAPIVKNATSLHFGDHTLVTNSNVFPYMAAILEKSKYLCAGALIDEDWVLTVAHSMYLFRDSLRFLQVRLGSINNKHGGELFPVKLIEVHPSFDDQRPEFDVALVRLAWKVRQTPSLNPIRIQKKLKKIIATHFLVTSWPTQPDSPLNTNVVMSTDAVTRRRMLQVAHLHPTNQEQCLGELEEMGLSEIHLMCLDRGEETDPCSPDIGAPVVLNRVLWGVVSSWVPEDCDLDPGPSFVTMVASPNISTWIYAVLHGKMWQQLTSVGLIDYEEDDDDD